MVDVFFLSTFIHFTFFYISLHFLRKQHNSQQLEEEEREKKHFFYVILFTFCDLCTATPKWVFNGRKSGILYVCLSDIASVCRARTQTHICVGKRTGEEIIRYEFEYALEFRDKVSRWVKFQLELRNDWLGRIVEKVAINNKLIRCFRFINVQCTHIVFPLHPTFTFARSFALPFLWYYCSSFSHTLFEPCAAKSLFLFTFVPQSILFSNTLHLFFRCCASKYIIFCSYIPKWQSHKRYFIYRTISISQPAARQKKN